MLRSVCLSFFLDLFGFISLSGLFLRFECLLLSISASFCLNGGFCFSLLIYWVVDLFSFFFFFFFVNWCDVSVKTVPFWTIFFCLKDFVLAHEMRSFCFSLLIAWVGTWYDVIWMLTVFLLTNIFCVVFFIIHFKILKNLFDEAFCFCAWYRRYSVLLLFNNWNRGCEGVFLDFELLWDLA